MGEALEPVHEDYLTALEAYLGGREKEGSFLVDWSKAGTFSCLVPRGETAALEPPERIKRAFEEIERARRQHEAG